MTISVISVTYPRRYSQILALFFLYKIHFKEYYGTKKREIERKQRKKETRNIFIHALKWYRAEYLSVYFLC